MHKIKAVTVNHNTSRFVELMIRSLFATNKPSVLSLDLTVLDNKSNDKYYENLLTYLKNANINITQTGFDNKVDVQKHGKALEVFVKENPDCEYYLFLDSDMWFIEDETIETMLSELDSAPKNTFGVQARIKGFYAKDIIEGKDGNLGYPCIDKMRWKTTIDGKEYKMAVKNLRCSPVCCLIKNDKMFRKISLNTGLTPAYIFRVGRIEYYDTFGLMTHIMIGNGRKYIVSKKEINHFTETSYKNEFRGARNVDVEKILECYM